MAWVIRPIILSGGSGTRLWPVSRKRHPKQFADLVGTETLFEGTLARVSDRKEFAPPTIIGNLDHQFLMQEALTKQHINDATIYLEIVGRNTAAAALIAALAEETRNEIAGDKVLHLVMPSDHVISDKAAFCKAVATAKPAAEAGHFVLFGIEPTHPDSGFGYIMRGEAMSYDGVKKIARFLEKPDTETAKSLIAEGAVWNSGIFFYDPSVLLAEAERLMPDEVALCRAALAKGKMDICGLVLDKASYAKLGNHPFDRAIMEKTDKGAVVGCSMGWSDLGVWDSLWQVENKDEQGNVTKGSVVTRDTTGSYIRSYGPTIAVMGVSDLTVVATKDSVLVAPRARSQEVRELIQQVEQTNGSLAVEHPCVRRPWGSYESIAQGERFQVKHIVVAPGRSLSLQMHHHRTEHWIVVAGTAEVVCDDVKKLVFPNESIYIPGGAKHRLSNPGKVELHLIEVQSGDYLGEDDIVRFEDLYGRVEDKA